MAKYSASAIALCLSIIPATMHSVGVAFEWLLPISALDVVNIVLPFFRFKLPSGAAWLSYEAGEAMLKASLTTVEAGKEESAEDFLFVAVFLMRQASAAHFATAVAAIYSLYQPIKNRHPVHVMNMAICALMAFINLNHAGIPYLGYNPFVSFAGQMVGVAFGPFWILAGYLHYLGYKASTAAGKELF